MKNTPKAHYILKGAFQPSHKMAPMKKRAYCAKIPHVKNRPSPNYAEHEGDLIFTQAVSPEKAINNAIFNTFHTKENDMHGKITKYLHTLDLTRHVLDLDELDEPVVQPSLFGGTKQSHKRRDEDDLTRKISDWSGIPYEGENSPPRQIARKYVKCRRQSSLTK